MYAYKYCKVRSGNSSWCVARWALFRWSPEAKLLDVIGIKSLESFPPCYSQSPILTHFTPPPPHPPRANSKSGLKLFCNVNIVYGNHRSALTIMSRNLNEIVRSWIRLQSTSATVASLLSEVYTLHTLVTLAMKKKGLQTARGRETLILAE
jgi:hypothetical protein